jgi:SEC-C motif-containing protein
MKYYIVSFFCLSMFLLETRAFAAKKRNNNKQISSSSSNKGFGVAPLTFEETLQSFKNRIPEHASTTICPCGSGLVYGDCCGPIHSRATIPISILPPAVPAAVSSPISVLRSRYTAFCWRNIGYIIASTHDTCRDYQQDKMAWAKSLNKNGMFDSFNFIQLNVVSQEEEQDVGEVNTNEDEDDVIIIIKFQVTLQSQESGQETTVTERSRFKCQNGQWLYAGGDVRSLEKGVHDIILNP